MNTLRVVSLLAATLTMGLVTGAFALYAHSIMPGLRTTDDRTFVAAFQAIDRAIINPWFMTGFLGALVFTGAATALHVGRDPLPWVAAALIAYGIVFAITLAVHVPLNDAIKATGDADPAGARERFHEARWAALNLVRTALSGGAFLALAWAHVVHGRGG